MTAYTTRMPAGIPGEVNRAWHAVIEPAVITPSGTTGAPTAYGVPLVVDTAGGNVGNMRTLASGDQSAGVVYGFLVRPFPTVSSQDAVGTSTPPASGACDVCRVGYMTVLLNGSVAATKGGRVWIYTGTTSGAHVTGTVEADTTLSSNGFALLGATFMGPADTSGNVEISFDCRNSL